ncbi:hypothetical protein IMPR6_70039 [Imperialibacter sp. EC-SDR9]|nr:hypothetical protein IMPR6_70039 [Imperialibacter sp. EC-SDR9]
MGVNWIVQQGTFETTAVHFNFMTYDKNVCSIDALILINRILFPIFRKISVPFYSLKCQWQ